MKNYYITPELEVFATTPFCLMKGSVKVDNNGAISDDGTTEDAENALGKKLNIWDDIWDDEEEEDEY